MLINCDEHIFMRVQFTRATHKEEEHRKKITPNRNTTVHILFGGAHSLEGYSSLPHFLLFTSLFEMLLPLSFRVSFFETEKKSNKYHSRKYTFSLQAKEQREKSCFTENSSEIQNTEINTLNCWELRTDLSVMSITLVPFRFACLVVSVQNC